METVILYIIISYFMMTPFCYNISGWAGFIIWIFSPIILPMKLGHYLYENL
jgi:uncharacterized protein (DUF983 family)